MGDLFRNQQSQQSTANNQVGVQGGIGIGASANAPAAGASGTAVLSNISTAGPINITTSDIEALHLVDNVTGNALGSNTAVTTAAINASYNTATNALALAQQIHGTDAVTTNNALAGALQITATAAPQSPGATAELLGAQSNFSQVYIAIAGAVIVGLIYYLSQRK